MAVSFSKRTEANLIAAGLLPGVPNPASPDPMLGPPPGAVSTPPIPPTSNGYTPPKWYRKLLFALRSSGESGALLFGPRGSGKTTAVHEACKSLSKPLITFQAANGCTIEDLIGQRELNNGTTSFTRGPLPCALAQDACLLIEEANVMHPGVFSKLNTLTDGSGDKLALPDGSALGANPGFRVILAFNEGAGYAGTRDTNAALRDRLMPIYAGYLPEGQEEQVLIHKTGCDPTTARRVVSLATAVRASSSNLGFDLSPRPMMRMLRLIRDEGFNWSDAFEASVLDLAGDPVDKAPQRDVLTQIAGACGLEMWDLPTFAPSATGGA